MKPKIIKTEAEYQAALEHLESLMDAAPGSPEEEELELFSILIEKYEEEHYPIDLPDPIEAIKFRMEQGGLTRKDLQKYIGSQSKVSEVLNRKRPLSLSMMRSLHDGLGIPAEVLLQEPGKKLSDSLYQWKDYPFVEMFKNGYFDWFKGTLNEAKVYAEEILTRFFSIISQEKELSLLAIREDSAEYGVNKEEYFGPEKNIQYVLCRKSKENPDANLIKTWYARVLNLAAQETLPEYKKESLTSSFFHDLVKLSFFDEGPRLAHEYLQKMGIHLIILPHLKRSYLDGASFISPNGNPIVGMTLRYDRLDNFWFTLAHELAHVLHHLDDPNIAFFDETEGVDESVDSREKEANQFARETLISPSDWQNWFEDTLDYISFDDIESFARMLQVSPAIVAGRIRWERGEYTNFGELLGQNKVRVQFGMI